MLIDAAQFDKALNAIAISMIASWAVGALLSYNETLKLSNRRRARARLSAIKNSPAVFYLDRNTWSGFSKHGGDFLPDRKCVEALDAELARITPKDPLMRDVEKIAKRNSENIIITIKHDGQKVFTQKTNIS